MQNIVVAGGFGALGQAVVANLITKGHRVAIVDMSAGATAGADIVMNECDLTDEATVEAAYHDIARRFGTLDGIVNLAGGFVWELVEGGSLESWDRMYNMNLRTALVSARAALHYLNAGSAIINVGAASATAPARGMAPYAASKAGVMALTESLAEELRLRAIRVNAVLPTIIDTPANRKAMPDADHAAWIKPSSAAEVITFLLSPQAGCITGTGIKLSLAG